MHVENIMNIMPFSWSCIAVNLTVIGNSVCHKNEIAKKEKTRVSAHLLKERPFCPPFELIWNIMIKPFCCQCGI